MRRATIRTTDERYAKAVLPLALYEGCKYLERVDGKESTYIINKRRLIQVRTSDRKGIRVFYWRFTFHPDDQKYLDDQDRNMPVHLLLICDDTICSLTWRAAKKLMDHHGKEKQQGLRVTQRKRGDEDEWAVNGSNMLYCQKINPSGLDDLWGELCT